MMSPVSPIAAGECCAQAVSGRAGCHLGQLARGRLDIEPVTDQRSFPVHRQAAQAREQVLRRAVFGQRVGRLASICNHRGQHRLRDPFAMPVVQDRHGEVGLVAVAAADGVNGPDGRLSRRFDVDSAPGNVI